MRKRKQKFIIFMMIIGVITLSMNKISEYGFAKDQGVVKEQTNDISVASDEAPTPEEYFDFSFDEYAKTAELTAFKKDRAEADEITEVIIPETIGEYTVTDIGEQAFFECKSLTSITIPNSVTGIALGAFMGCEFLQSIQLPANLTHLGEGAFMFCSALESITLPDKVKYLGMGVFYGCQSLKSIRFPNSVIDIGSLMFSFCDSLETVVVDNTLGSLSAEAFNDSAVKNLIFICQDINDMKIIDRIPVSKLESRGITIYRMAVGNINKIRNDPIVSYEFVGTSISFADLFEVESGVIYKGAEGTEAYEGNEIKIADYFNGFITSRLQGDIKSKNTRIDNNKLYIGSDETAENISLQVSYNSKQIEIPINIVKAKSIVIKEAPNSQYSVGDKYSPAGLIITMIYQDGYQRDIKYKDNKEDFSFALNDELNFETSEQEITYQGLTVTQPLTIYEDSVLSDSNIKVTGKFTEGSSLVIKDVENIDNDLKDKEIIGAYNLIIDGGYWQTLTIEFDIGNEYEGKKLNIRHNGNVVEEFEKTVNEGKIIIEVDNLSPFIIYTEKEIVEEPDTPIIPKPDEPTPDIPDNPDIPIIKPIEPSPDISVPTKPQQSQPNIMKTEDNNHLLLWGVLSIMSIGVIMIVINQKQQYDKKSFKKR